MEHIPHMENIGYEGVMHCGAVWEHFQDTGKVCGLVTLENTHVMASQNLKNIYCILQNMFLICHSKAYSISRIVLDDLASKYVVPL